MEEPTSFLTEEGTLLNANLAIVDLRKLIEYALNPDHPVGGHKALLFHRLLGYTKEDAFDLLEAIQTGILTTPARPGRVNADGSRFSVDLSITGKTTRTAIVRTAWIYDPGRLVPRLTTIFIL